MYCFLRELLSKSVFFAGYSHWSLFLSFIATCENQYSIMVKSRAQVIEVWIPALSLIDYATLDKLLNLSLTHFHCLQMCIIVVGIIKLHIYIYICFPGNSAGKESTFNAGDPSLISGLGRYPREGIGYPLQYSWASMVAQVVKNLPAMQDTWVWSLGWKDSLEEGMASYSSILAWRIPMDRGASQESDMTEQLSCIYIIHIFYIYIYTHTYWASLMAQEVNKLPAKRHRWCGFDPWVKKISWRRKW